MNILILSVGTRNKLVQYFKKELQGEGTVVATDCNNLAPGLYDADRFYIVPRITEKNYLDIILDICEKENIKAVFSLIDPELSLISKNKERFLEIGVTPIVSDYEQIELCFNKYNMYKFLRDNNIKTAKTYISKEEFYNDLNKGGINFPVFVKPVTGSCSVNTNKVNNVEELEMLFSNYDDLIIQEYMNGIEYDADVYIDMISNKVIEIFTKEKISRTAGETYKTVSMKDEKLYDIIKNFLKKSNFKGIIDIDVFKVNNEYYISEVNPRFGGIYPHSYECGMNVPRMIINNLKQISNEENIGNYNQGLYMLKYHEIKII